MLIIIGTTWPEQMDGDSHLEDPTSCDQKRIEEYSDRGFL